MRASVCLYPSGNVKYVSKIEMACYWQSDHMWSQEMTDVILSNISVFVPASTPSLPFDLSCLPGLYDDAVSDVGEDEYKYAVQFLTFNVRSLRPVFE
jgi:hypothetical protein